MKKRSILVVLALLVLVLGVALVPVMAQDEEMEIAEPAMVFDAPEGYEEVGTNTYQMGAETIQVINDESYTLVLGGEEFEDDASELAFFVGRTGYSVGGEMDVTHDNVLAAYGIALARREQQGQAYLVDLGLGLRAVVVSLHTGRGRVGAPAADVDVVLSSINFTADVVQAAAIEGSFNTLTAALEASGLDMALHGEGPFTVFAPTDDAFEALFISLGITEEQLLAADYLDDVLLYHVVAGSVDAATLTENYLDADSIETLLPTNNIFAFTGIDGKLYLNNAQSEIVSTDIMATNGVIHVIDGVLLPQCAIDAINGSGGCD